MYHLLRYFGKKSNNLSFNFKGHKIFNLYDSVHLIKNVRNNLLNSKRFVFPPFDFKEFEDDIHVDGGEISWHLLHNVHEQDGKLPGNLRKAHKLTSKTLHPGNNKQSVPLALNIFDETTSAAILSYFPSEVPAAQFLKLLNNWWTMSNSKTRYNTHNRFGDAAIPNDRKPQFFRAFSQWLEEWQELQISGCSKFTLSFQTFDALITTLRGTAE